MTITPTLLRAVALFWPLLLGLLLWIWRQPQPRLVIGILLAALWNGVTLLGLHLLAQHFGWWRFAAEGGLFLGIPLDLYFGWVALWSIVPALIFAPLSYNRGDTDGSTGPQSMGQSFPPLAFYRRQLVQQSLNLALLLLLMLGIDLVTMPHLAPVLELGQYWGMGEGLGILGCLLPAQLLAFWTARNDHLLVRSGMLILLFGAIFLLCLPTIIFAWTADSWYTLWQRPLWVTSIWVQLFMIPSIVGVSAVGEFAQRGKGTPLPFDPPTRLVSSGIYAYIANPMQLAMVLLLFGLSLLLQSRWLALAAAVALIYSIGLAYWSERGDLETRFGRDWGRYRQAVANWWPRWRPWHPSLLGRDALPADQLYLAMSCEPCSELAIWFAKQEPVGLELHPAETFPGVLPTRITYRHGADGTVESGVAAFARGLEHLHLGWALVGMTLRLPLLCQFAQLLADAVGATPRQLQRNILQTEHCASAAKLPKPNE